MIRKLVLVLALLAGCMSAPQPEGIEYATQIVWQQQYLMGSTPPPTVYWMYPPQLNCEDGRGWVPPAGQTPYPCVGGLYYSSSNTAYVALPDGFQLSDLAFAHELCHAWSFLTTGDGDTDHTGPCFKLPGGYVQIANDALGRAGL